MAADSSTAGLTSKLARFSSQHDDIALLTTTFESESFDTLRPIFVNPHANPLAIIRPSTIEAVSATVRFLATNQIPFTVRVGGHDMHGRSVEDGGVVLDLRLLNHVVINKSGSEAKGGKIATARIGGGVLIGDLLSALEPHGLATPVGTVSGVGYLGWAMHGGYGPYSSGFGLGVDQIVAAKVVDATGSIVDADGELLKGIKGAGGAFGVVVEAVVRVYELDSILAGTLVFNSQDLATAIRSFSKAYRALALTESIPPALNIFSGILSSPQTPAPIFILLVNWTSPNLSEGKEWIEKIATLIPSATATLVANTVQKITPKACIEAVSKLVAPSVQGRMYSVSFKEITDEVAGVIAHFTSAERMPRDEGVLFEIHELRAVSPSANANTSSVFSAREPHSVVAVCATAAHEENVRRVLKWGEEFQAALKRTKSENILPTSYISFLSREEMERDQERIFGGHLPFLKDLKRRLDSENVFRAAISSL
ncbi:hypothetical protein BDW60DRAFT_203516 [Aspergillus nidulans var. acristatus]